MKKEEIERIVLQTTYKDSEGRRDICPIYRNREAMKEIVKYLAEPYRGEVDYVAAPESIGFILGSMLADELDVGFIPIRNGEVAVLEEKDAIRASYIDHRDHPRKLQVRRSNLPAGSKILLVDDWIDTAATMTACMAVIEDGQATVSGIAAIGANINPMTAKSLANGFIRCVVSRG